MCYNSISRPTTKGDVLKLFGTKFDQSRFPPVCYGYVGKTSSRRTSNRDGEKSPKSGSTKRIKHNSNAFSKCYQKLNQTFLFFHLDFE
jgi:hypothetical protein